MRNCHRSAIAVLFLTSACVRAPLPVDGGRAPSPVAAPTVPARSVSEWLAMPEPEYLRARLLVVPVRGVAPERIPDTFLAARGTRVHRATDIMAPQGTPVIAVDAGRVVRLRSNGIGGITIYLEDSEGRFVYYYAHLDRYRDGLVEGARVMQGELVGYVGVTGNAPRNTPHLHFQAMRRPADSKWWTGEPVDVRPYLVTGPTETLAQHP